MIRFISIRERGATPGLMKREFNRIAKESWIEASKRHHAENTAKRFTEAHAREAGYTKRKGEGLTRGTAAFARSYYGRKLRSEKGGGRGQAFPLVYSGYSQRMSRYPSISATATRAKLKFKTPVFNFRHPRSRVRMAEEFRRVLPREARDVARNYDRDLDRRLSHITATKTTRIT